MATELLEGGNAYRIARALETISISQYAKGGGTPSTFAEVAKVVQDGKAKKYFKIGDQIITAWSPDGETSNDIPWDVVDFGPVTDENGVIHENAMWLQSHYGVAEMQYDHYEAFYYAENELPAGTYHFTTEGKWSNWVDAGSSVQFTLTKNVPAGGIIALGNEDSDGPITPLWDPETYWRVRVYDNVFSDTASETVNVVIGTGGTSLGTIYDFATNGNLNSRFPIAQGNAQWSKSPVRQWLNSDKASGEWWVNCSNFDRRPIVYNKMRGFMAGLPNDFLSVIKPVQVVTKVLSASDDQTEITYDKFFIASASQEYIVQPSAVEGQTLQYWIDRLEGEQEFETRVINHTRYRIDQPETSVGIWLRTPSQNGLQYKVSNTGYVTARACGESRDTVVGGNSYVAPVCVIY